MNNKPPNRELDRVTYWEGQMLRSSDFLGIQRVEDQRRWWHNRAVHNAYGVYQGFQASAVGGKQDVVQVNPGVAYDCFGRELILECRATIQYAAQPLAQGDVRTLLVRYKRPPSRRDSDPVTAVCCFCNGRYSSGNIEFIWTDNRRISPQDGVALGRVPGGPNRGGFSGLRTPPRSRALARPHLATGSTVPGNTSWQPWDFTPPASDVAASFPIEIGVQTTIDTSAAGFTQIPQYFAWLEGSIWNPATVQLVPTMLQSIADESLESFIFRLILMVPERVVIGEGRLAAALPADPINLIQRSDDFADFAQQQGLYVAWLGSQMPAATPFVLPKQNSCQANYRAEYVRGTR